MNNNSNDISPSLTCTKSLDINSDSNDEYQQQQQQHQEEPVDPRVQGELERLNSTSSDINNMENELEQAKSLFNTLKSRQLQRLEILQKKLGPCISKAKPYYEYLHLCESLKLKAQTAVQDFQKANSLYKTAKETLSVAEQSLTTGEIPSAMQEHLSEVCAKINLSKKNADIKEEYHRRIAKDYQQAEQKCQQLEISLKSSISKSRYNTVSKIFSSNFFLTIFFF
jgi:SH3-domain binding protein 5